jgi:hypothetical protein
MDCRGAPRLAVTRWRGLCLYSCLAVTRCEVVLLNYALRSDAVGGFVELRASQ